MAQVPPEPRRWPRPGSRLCAHFGRRILIRGGCKRVPEIELPETELGTPLRHYARPVRLGSARWLFGDVRDRCFAGHVGSEVSPLASVQAECYCGTRAIASITHFPMSNRTLPVVS
jgi:hypothetical protein